MKVVFLDIDGVLNSEDWYLRRLSNNLNLDPVAVGRLADLLDRSGAVVVVSSTWRIMHTLPNITRMLVANGLQEWMEPRLIGTTTSTTRSHRGSEIAMWLNHVPGVTSFVILDDDSDMEPHMSRLVQTSFETGLTLEHVTRAVEVLRTPLY